MNQSFLKFPFLEYYKKHRSNKYISRCLACHYIQEKMGYVKVAKIMKYSKQTIIEWVKTFNEGGIDLLLVIRSGRGRKPRIGNKDEDKELFSQAVMSLQKERSGGRIIGQEIVDMIKEKYNKSYTLSGVYKVLKRMGLSWVSSRSIHPKANLKQQESFKKNLPKCNKNLA